MAFGDVFGVGLPGLTGGLLVLFYLLIVWTLIWKGIGLWKAGRNNQLVWFIVILIFNTAGILPIIYILFFQKKDGKKGKKK